MPASFIDTHCHLDAAEFDADRDQVIADAFAAGVTRIVIPAVEAANFEVVARLAASTPGATYALGIHPMYTPRADESDIGRLRDAIAAALARERGGAARLVAVGEIGLDLFVPSLTTPEARARQEWFYAEQLKLARDFGLPVLLHVRRSQDLLLKHLRRIDVPGGIAHAFNGSRQQADTFIGLGFRLGFGGAMTYARALQIRHLAAELPESALVLETDAPDIAPDWLMRQRNTPGQLPRIAATLAQLRGWTMEQTASVTSANAEAALPGLRHRAA